MSEMRSIDIQERYNKYAENFLNLGSRYQK